MSSAPLFSGLRPERRCFGIGLRSLCGHADADGNIFGDLRFRWCVVMYEMVRATRKKDSGGGIEPAEFGGCSRPFRSLVESRAFPLGRYVRVDRSSQHHNSGDRTGKRRTREPIFKNSRTISAAGPIGTRRRWPTGQRKSTTARRQASQDVRREHKIAEDFRHEEKHQRLRSSCGM